MSINNNSRTVTDGLVMYYDANNVKSYVGPPLQNVLTQITPTGIGSSAGYVATTGSETVNIPTLGDTFVNYVTIQNNYSAVSTNCCPSLYYYGAGTLLPSTLYTYAIVYKCESGYTGPNFMYQYDYNSATYVTEFGLHSTSQRIHLGGGWYWAWATFTTQATVNTLQNSGLWYYQYSTGVDKITVAKAMMVKGDYTAMHPKYWPALNTTRSTTQAIVDLTGNNTLTATSLTYTNDGTFNFAGSSYANVNYNAILDLTNVVSLCAWVKYTASTNVACIEKSNNNTHYQLQIFSSAQGSGLGGELVFMLQPNASNWVVATVASNDNNWHYVVGTYDRYSTTAKIYIDGVLKNTNAAITTGPTSNVSDLLIGSRSGIAAGMGGSIPVVKIYNRVLTAAEVAQNFNALRGRYGV